MNFDIKNKFYNFFGDWGLGIGDWGFGVWGFGPSPKTPNQKAQNTNPKKI